MTPPHLTPPSALPNNGELFSLSTATAGLPFHHFLSSNITTLRAGMFLFHSFIVSLYNHIFLWLLQSKTPPQDPPRFQPFRVFSHLICLPSRPLVAIYISHAQNTHLSCTTVFHDSLEMLSVDIFSLESLFGFCHRCLRITSVYLLHTHHPLYPSLPHYPVFSPPLLPHLVLQDFNHQYPLADPFCSLRDKEYKLSTVYFDVTFAASYNLLNTPGVYTLFAFDTISRQSVPDLIFANFPLCHFVSSGDTPLPSKGSDQVSMVVILQLPEIMLPPPTPCCVLLAWPSIREAIVDFSFESFPGWVTTKALGRWFNIFSTRWTILLTSHTLGKRLCPWSKLWRSQCLSTLRRE